MDTKPLKELILEVQEGDVPPGRMAEIVTQMSSWSATIGEALKNTQLFKADRWLEIRKDTTSDKMADRLWDATPEGKEEMNLRSQLKYLDKIIGSLKLRLRTLESEAWGRY
jgi:hypothetical protein